VRATTPAGPWRAVSAGAFATCATRDDGVWCWGKGTDGQLGDGATATSAAPVRAADGAWAAVSVGQAHACELIEQRLECWGSDEFGAVGDGPPIGATQPTPIAVGAAATRWRSLSDHGGAHQCGLREDGTAWCWGHNGLDQLGAAVPSEQRGFVRWPGPSWGRLALGRFTTCGVAGDRTISCAGYGATGLRGDGTLRSGATPSVVPGAWSELGVGDYHACAIDDQRALACWGANYVGERGTGVAGSTATPVALTGRWERIGAGSSFTCAIDEGHDLWCWGANTLGQCGDGSGSNRPTPALILLDGEPWRDLAVGVFHACAIDGGGQLWCWGVNGNRQVGVGATTATVLRATQVSGAPDWRRVAVGATTTCGLRGPGALWCWGSNHAGQAGVGAATAQLDLPTRVGDADDWQAVAVGTRHACGVRDGALYCWGDAEWGATGLPAAVDVPTLVGADRDWRDVAIAGDVTCARKGDGSTWCAGANRYGQTGFPAVVAAPTPVVDGPP
jgi:alpha-tubulin suppressor-like RCC1 family protein